MEAVAFTEVFTEHRDAVFSPNGDYRYRLIRRWGEGKTLLFVMLNPSTADANADDNTVRKCMRYARINGFTGIEVVNLFAYCATDPIELRLAGYPVGPGNDAAIRESAARIVADGGKVCVAWGANVKGLARPNEVLRMLAELGAVPHTLKLTRDGYPSHPLYLSSMCKLVRYEAPLT